MALISLGDMAHTFMMRRQTTELKLAAQVASTEMITGRTADTAAHLRGDLVPFVAIEASLTRLDGYRAVTQEMAVMTGTMQTVLGAIDTLTEDITPALLNLGMTGGLGTMQTIVADAGQRLEGVISALNTRLGDRSLFAGVATDQPAMASADVILTALETAISASGATTADQIEGVVTDWFADPAGFRTVGYQGGAALGLVPLSPEDRADLSLTAADPGLQSTLRGLALAALLDRGAIASAADTRQALAKRAGQTLLQGQTDRAALAGSLGVAEARIDSAATRNQAEASALNLARSGLLATDPYEAATRMEAAQSQLESLYAVTARLSRLSLVDFLR